MKLKKQNKHYWWILLIVVVVITAPFVINWVILQPQKFEVVGDGTHWLGFWATYISAVASFAMVVITWVTLKQSKKQNELILQQNKEQLNELKRQWEEEQRPYLEIALVKIGYPYQYFIEIRNIGKTSADNITFNFDSEFINGIGNKEIGNALSGIGTNPFKILSNELKRFKLIEERSYSRVEYFNIAGAQINEEQYNIVSKYLKSCDFVIQGEYNMKYKIFETLSISNAKEAHWSLIDSVLNVGNMVAMFRTSYDSEIYRKNNSK